MDEQTQNLDSVLSELGATPVMEPQAQAVESDLASLGARPVTEQEIAEIETTGAEKALGYVEAGLRGLVSRPVVAAVQKGFGVKPEEAKKREMAIGAGATAAELLGLAAPSLLTLGAAGAARLGIGAAAKAAAPLATLGEFTQAGLLSKAGQAAVKKLGVKGAAAVPAVAMGVENALFAVADETAKAIEGNPNTAQQAIYNVGMSGLLGTATGGALGKVGDLWKTKYGPKYKSFMSDFAGRVKDHTRGTLPAAEAVGAELQTIINNADEATGLITGAQGLKRQELAKMLPEVADQKIIDHASKAFSDVSDYLEKVVKEPGTYRVQGSKMIREARDRMLDEITRPNATAADVFFALDDFKQQIGPLGKFDPRFMGAAQKPGTNAINNLYKQIRTNLEDESIWGAAAKRQKEINQAASKFFRTVKDLKSVAMSKGPGGEWVVNPDKLNTLINQAKKGKAEVKQNILNDFLDSVDDLYNTVEKVDEKFGVASSLERPTMTASRAVTEKLTPGMKAADFIYQEAINNAATGAGGYVGYKVGKTTQVPGVEWLGALFGSQALEPVLKKVMPVLIRPLSGVGATAGSVRAASQLIGAVATGENLSKMAADALFLQDKEVPIKYMSDKDLEKVDRSAREIQSDVRSALDFNEDLGQLLPNHSFSLASSAMNALSYLNSKRPVPKQNGALDKEIKPSGPQWNAYKRTLQIAQNPLVVLKRAKDGTLLSSDVVDLQSMYPDLYNDIVKKVTVATIDYTSTGKRIPYKIQKSLSLLAGAPLQTDFTPQSIQAAQAVFQKANVPPQQMPAMAPKSSRKSQIPSLTETDSQRRMLNR